MQPQPGSETTPDTVPGSFSRTVARRPDAPLIHYFDSHLTARQLDEASDAMAAALLDTGFGFGDRAVMYMQNVPQLVIAQLAVWKLGGIVVAANPMYRESELEQIVVDSGATALFALETLFRDNAAALPARTGLRAVYTCSELEFVGEVPDALAHVERVRAPGTLDMVTVMSDYSGAAPAGRTVAPGDTALLTYTSGTTEPPKGTMTSHRNLAFNAATYRRSMEVDDDDVILGVAPLFHITGVVGHTALSLVTGAQLVLVYRFHPEGTAELVRRHRATFTVGSITLFIAWLNSEAVTREHLATLTTIYSGGAPVPPATVERFEAEFGHYIHNNAPVPSSRYG